MTLIRIAIRNSDQQDIFVVTGYSSCTAYVGVGTNLGDRVQNLIDARQHLQDLPATAALRCSSLYLSSPVGYAEQSDFINCVIEIHFKAGLQSLFESMQDIEQRMGRTRDPENRNAPRIIDLDLLLFGDARRESVALTVPHPRILERLFVIEPLLELNAELAIPGHGKLSAILERGRQSGLFSGQDLHILGG